MNEDEENDYNELKMKFIQVWFVSLDLQYRVSRLKAEGLAFLTVVNTVAACNQPLMLAVPQLTLAAMTGFLSWKNWRSCKHQLVYKTCAHKLVKLYHQDKENGLLFAQLMEQADAARAALLGPDTEETK